MWSDVKANHNKFYIMQVLQKGASFYHWIRFGRVGYDGNVALHDCYTKENAEKEYNKKYKEKTRKGYTDVKMAIGKSDDASV